MGHSIATGNLAFISIVDSGGMTLADRGERVPVNQLVVDDFRALVARLGIMHAVDQLFGGDALGNGVAFPDRPFTLYHVPQPVGDPEWLMVAGESDTDLEVHLDGAPGWVRELVCPDDSPALVAWGRPGDWDVSAERESLGERGLLPPVDFDRPWMSDDVRPLIVPALSDVGTRHHFQTLLPNDEPDVLVGANLTALSHAAWNAFVSPAVVTNKQRLAASLRSLSAHVHLLPLEASRITQVVRFVERLWFTYLPGQPKPLTEVPGVIDIPPRAPSLERELTRKNTAFVWGWAIAAMSEAARAVPVAQRVAHFDESGLLIRQGRAWARLIALDADRMAMVGVGHKDHVPTATAFPRPSWVPDLEGEFGGEEAWTVRGLWRGRNATGPLTNIDYLATAQQVKPNGAANLPAALAVVPDPVTPEAQVEVLEMMQGLQDFTWNDCVLATRPAFGTTPSSYPF